MTTNVLDGLDLEAELRALDWSAPTVLTGESRSDLQADAAVVGAVAAVTGVALGVVIYICSVCSARSFSSCLRAVRNYWTSGC